MSSVRAQCRCGLRSDVEACVELWARAAAARNGAPVDGAGARARDKLRRDGAVVLVAQADGAVVLVAQADGAMVGFAAAHPSAAAAGPHRRTAYVALLAVDPARQRGGLGSSLLQRTIDHLAELCFAAAELRVLVGNRAARSLYERLGWREVGEPTPHEHTGRLMCSYELVFGPE